MSIKSFVLSHKILYELYFLLSCKTINRKKIEKKIFKLKSKKFNIKKDLIVSLTSYGERIPDLKYTLYSLIMQTIHPEKIVVWLSYDEKIVNELNIFKQFGVEFRFCEDIKSYKKLIPALKEFPDKYIVTADDDIYYQKNWLRNIWNCHLRNLECKITHIAHIVSFSPEKKLIPYNLWKHNVYSASSGRFFFPTGCGGTLYPPHPVSEDFLNERLFMKLCPNADDVWFYFMGLLSGQTTIVVPHPYNRLKYVDIYKEYGLNKKTTLQSINVANNQNDVQIHNVMEYFNITDEKLYKLINQV